MKKFISTLTILSCFLLAACEDKVYDVSYYAEHLEQAQDVVEKMQQRGYVWSKLRKCA